MAEEMNTIDSTAEQAEPAKEQEKTFTQSEVDKIIESRLNKFQKAQEAKIAEAQKLAQMNEAEKQQYRIDELEKKLNEYERAETRSAMGKTARGMLREANISVTDSLIEMLITENADTTKTNVESFAQMFNEAVEEAVKERLRGTTPKAPSNSAITKEQIMAVKDKIERQRLIAENIELFR